jgi:hypothetical protein
VPVGRLVCSGCCRSAAPGEFTLTANKPSFSPAYLVGSSDSKGRLCGRWAPADAVEVAPVTALSPPGLALPTPLLPLAVFASGHWTPGFKAAHDADVRQGPQSEQRRFRLTPNARSVP